MPVPVLIDCDPGHDDAIALLLALASPEVELLGVTTVAGNQTLDKTTANALRVLELAGRGDVPVAAGAERLLDCQRPVTLIPTGPLTNVALLLARHPHVAGRIERIVLMGGAIGEGNVTPAAEFNIWVDPEAAARVFASGLDVTMAGLDVTHQALLTAAHADRLREAGRIGAFVADLHGFYARFHRQVYGWDGAPVHDAVAVAHVIRADLMRTERVNVEVDRASELCRGRTVVDRRGRTGRPANAHVGVELDGEAFLDLLIERLASLG